MVREVLHIDLERVSIAQEIPPYLKLIYHCMKYIYSSLDK